MATAATFARSLQNLTSLISGGIQPFFQCLNPIVALCYFIVAYQWTIIVSICVYMNVLYIKRKNHLDCLSNISEMPEWM